MIPEYTWYNHVRHHIPPETCLEPSTLRVSNQAEFAAGGEEELAISRESIWPGTMVVVYGHPVSHDGTQRNRDPWETGEWRLPPLPKKRLEPPVALSHRNAGDLTPCVFVEPTKFTFIVTRAQLKPQSPPWVLSQKLTRQDTRNPSF